MSGNLDLELSEIDVGKVSQDPQYLNREDFMIGIELENNPRMNIFGFDNRGLVESNVKRISFGIEVKVHRRVSRKCCRTSPWSAKM